MKSNSSRGIYRATAFFLIAAICAAIVGFALEGWRTTVSAVPQFPQANVDRPSDEQQQPIEEPKPQTPVYYNYLTGAATDAALSTRRPIVFSIDPRQPLYGVSDAPLTIEIPVENGESRYLVYSDRAEALGKIGTLTPTRTYMSNLTRYFGGILLTNGTDDTFTYDGFPCEENAIDLSRNSAFCYLENGTRMYTYGYLVQEALRETAMQTEIDEPIALPFLHNAPDAARIVGATAARSVVLPYSQSNETELYYYESENGYVLSKANITQSDRLNDKSIIYQNVFVLFADAVTYERSSGTEMVLDTVSGGAGYYISGGTLTRIAWSVDAAGNMLFRDTAGKQLVVNRGNSYVAFFKASQKNAVRFG